MQKNYFIKNLLSVITFLAVSVSLVSCISFFDNVDNPSQNSQTPTKEENTNPSNTKSLSIGVDINKDNSLSNIIENADGDIIQLFAEKDDDGYPVKLKEMVVLQNDGMTSDFMFDEKERITYCEAPNGVTFSLEWETDNYASFIAIDPTTDEQISSYIDLTEDEEDAETPAIAQTRTAKSSSPRNGELAINVSPIYSSPSVKANTRAEISGINTSRIIYLNLKQCETPVDYQCGIDVLYKGKTTARLYGTRVSEGVYKVQLPESLYPEYAKEYDNAGKGCEKIFEFLNGSCVAMDVIEGGKVAWKKVLKLIGKKVVSDIKMSKGNQWLIAAFELYCATVSNQDPEKYVCESVKDIRKFYLDLYKDAELEQSYKVTLFPRVWDNSVLGLGFNPIEVDLRWLEMDHIDLDWGGEPSISKLTLSPSFPVAGQNYTIKTTLQCIPAGSTVTVTIKGTDNYYKQVPYTFYDVAENYSMEVNVPGAAQGVVDVCEVVLYTPNKTYKRNATLIFM